MFIFPEQAKEILRELIEAEQNNQVIPLAQALERWGRGSTWEDLIDAGYLNRKTEAVTVNQKGMQWFYG